MDWDAFGAMVAYSDALENNSPAHCRYIDEAWTKDALT